MAPIVDKPFLEYVLQQLTRGPINSCILSVGYLWESIYKHFGEQYKGLEITYQIEESPLGTGGAVWRALDYCTTECVLLLNGDTFFDVDLIQLSELHEQKNAMCTLALKEMNHISRYGTVVLENSKIVSFREKSPVEHGYINGGVYVINKDLLKQYKMPEKFSFETDFLVNKVSEMTVLGYPSRGNFIDIGIPEDYEAAQVFLPKWVSEWEQDGN